MNGADSPAVTPFGVLRGLAALRRNLGLYPSGHVVISQSLSELERVVARALDEHGRLRIELVGGTAHIDGQPFRLESQTNPDLIAELSLAGVECLQIDPGVEGHELLAAAEVLAERRGSAPAPGGSVGQALLARGAHHVSMTRLLPIGARQNGARGWPSVPERVHDRPYAGVLESARESVGAVFEGSGPDPERVTALIDTVREQIVDRGSALREILSVKEYENHTYCHSVNVAALSLLLGRRIGLDDAQLDMLAEGALLHDVGKRGVPVEIIRKAGPLNQREWRIMQRHPALGAELLATTGGFSALTPTIALEHHREYGGGGYPDLGDLEPHLISQIVAVADTYEALTGARAYRPPLVPDEACLILARMAGAKLNPALVRSFVGLITFFPLGSLVRTSRGEVGAVIGTFEEEPLHPTIVLVGEDGSALSPRRTIDMAARGPDGAYLRYVVETLPSPAGRLPDDVWAIEEAGPAMVPGEAEPQRPPVGGRGSGQRPARPERRPVA